MIVVWLFLAVPWVCLQFVIVVFPDHSHLLFFIEILRQNVSKRTTIIFFYKQLQEYDEKYHLNFYGDLFKSFRCCFCPVKNIWHYIHTCTKPSDKICLEIAK